MLILSADDVRRALQMSDAIEAMKRAFAGLAAGRANAPMRTHMRIDDHNGDVLVMPAALQGDEGEALAVKVVSIYPDNVRQNLPRINAAVLVIDPETGQPVACLEGGTLTGIRTAAGSAAATDLLARPESRTLAILGAGVQARTHLEAICCVRPIETVRIYSPTRGNVERLIDEMADRSEIQADLIAADSASAAIDGADIICATTTSAAPVFSDADVAPGTHITAVGSYKPAVAEIPAETVARALVVVDDRTAAWDEAGDLIQPLQAGMISKDHIHADLGELVLGKRPGRSSPEEITLFKSVGLAIQDAAAAAAALRNAERQNLGQRVAW